MNRNFLMSLLIILLLANGWAILYFQFPFYLLAVGLLIVSVLNMALMHERFVFLYTIIMVIGYAALLTVAAFINNQPVETQLLYIYDHVLFTSFILMFWVLNHYTKRLGYENVDLRKQVKELQKRQPNTSILTMNEFQEQAKWTLASVQRNNKQAWLVELTIDEKSKSIRRVVQEKIEEAGLRSIRSNFDLITSSGSTIYVLLRDTEHYGVEIVLHRIEQKLKEILNYIDPPYQVRVEQIDRIEKIQQIGA
ncbi:MULTISPECIES: hypothetical protein [Gracilibacillus]|uniref:hypothetical protein n=1 Tax=Gracilibacillus TaxID=74385 RepID=UPI0008266A3C|nr:MULTISPECIES: hypothetical protein [Gracilibacillus]